MTTAKSQQPGDNGADDLISELARLMAQDARTDHPTSPMPPRPEAPGSAPVAAQPQNPAAPGVRIPGAGFRNQPAPRFDSGVSAAAQLVSDLNKSEHAKVVAPEVAAAPNAAPTPQRGPLDDIVEPFRFDFGGVSPSIDAILRPGAAAKPAVTPTPAPVPPQPPKVAAQPMPTPAPVAKAPEPTVRTPEPMVQQRPVELAQPKVVTPAVPVASPSVAAPVPPQDTMEFHDSIADLIAADMPADEQDAAEDENEPEIVPDFVEPEIEDEPAEVAVAPEPQPEPIRPQLPIATQAVLEPTSRAEPVPSRPIARTWAPTPVAGARAANATPIGRSNVRPANLTPVSRPVREPSAPAAVAPQGDSFNVAPIFGLGGPVAAPSAPTPVADPRLGRVTEVVAEPIEPEVHFAPQVSTAPDVTTDVGADYGTDPIDEIESLIGNAVRVDLDTRHRPVSSAALRDLAKPSAIEPQFTTPPTRIATAPVSQDPILEAVQASGGEATWNEPAVAVEEEELIAAPRQRKNVRQAAPRGSVFRAIAGPLVAVALLLVAGLGLYWVLGLGGRPDAGSVPTLVADTTPTKEAPAPVAPTDTQQSVVFKEINGQAPAEDEQLVSRDQSNATEVVQTPTAETNDDGLANRKVRTVTVRPDGTIVSGEDSVAGSTILPVDRPNVPTVPGAQVPSPELVAAANDAASALASNTPAAALPATPATTDPAAAATATTPATVATTPAVEAPAAPVQPGSIVPVVDAAGTVVTGKQAQIPKVRPSQFTNLDRPAPTSAANAVGNGPIPLSQALATSNTPAAAPAAAGGAAPAYVQLSSQRSQADAQASAINLSNRYGSLFGGAQPEIQKVDLGAKGTFYRVRVPAASQQAANAICGSIKANGGECF